MPAIIDNYRVTYKHDKRVKLTNKEREQIKELRASGMKQQAVADHFNVSRRTVQFICDPQKLKENLEKRKERGGSMIYYNKDIHAAAMRRHREYKRQLYGLYSV